MSIVKHIVNMLFLPYICLIIVCSVVLMVVTAYLSWVRNCYTLTIAGVIVYTQLMVPLAQETAVGRCLSLQVVHSVIVDILSGH